MITDHSTLQSAEVFIFCDFQMNFRILKLRFFFDVASEQAVMEANSKESYIKQSHCRYEMAYLRD